MAGGGRGSRPFSSKARSVITLVMMASAALLVFLIFNIVGLPTGNNIEIQKGGAIIALQNPQLVGRTTLLDGQVTPPKVQVLSWEPRAFVYYNMLSDEECDHLITLARPNMVKSTVVDSATGRSKDSRVRTSSGTFLNRGQDAIIKGVEEKIAQFTLIPVDHGEGLQVLHYEVGQKYEAHYDYFHDTFNTQNGGQRIATVLMYLSDVAAGGETVFPAAKVNNKTLDWEGQSKCAKAGLAVRPKKGMALLFWSLDPDTQKDPKSLHGGCPVIEGDKWSATKWLHIDKYSVPS
ncbi:unnamed protein product [Calypogeia fissa]